MMKPRSNRGAQGEQAAASSRASKTESAEKAQLLNNTQANAQVIRKRRSSINVYDQPSSLNSRLRQLETDMLRLDEDRARLYDDTHTALSHYELKLNEIQAILKSRQDNVDKYVEDMKSLLLAKEEFERQTKLLHDKHDRVHEKFMHRETTIAREIKLLKNKFEALEKSRQFRSILQKSASNMSMGDIHNHALAGLADDSPGGGDPNQSGASGQAGNETLSEGSLGSGLVLGRRKSLAVRLSAKGEAGVKSVRIKLAKLNPVTRLLRPLVRRFRTIGGSGGGGGLRRPMGRKSNRVASVGETLPVAGGGEEPAAATPAVNPPS